VAIPLSAFLEERTRMGSREKHTFRGSDGRTYERETNNYGNGSSVSVTRQKANTVWGSDRVVKVEKRSK
jgi:hypothetical protein